MEKIFKKLFITDKATLLSLKKESAFGHEKAALQLALKATASAVDEADGVIYSLQIDGKDIGVIPASSNYCH